MLPGPWTRGRAGACRNRPHHHPRTQHPRTEHAGTEHAGTWRRQCLVAATLAVVVPAAVAARADGPPARGGGDPVAILFVGNSFTHGRYLPALTYNAGPGNGTDPALVHDLLCPSLGADGACASGAEGTALVVPTAAATPGATVLDKLTFLQANPAAQYTEHGPFGGVAGVFLQFTREAGLRYDVSLIAVSSATLRGYLNDKGNEAGVLPLIADARYDRVVLQDQSFQPLPATVTVAGQSVPTRGNPTSFQLGVNGLVAAIDAADAAAGRANAVITLDETQPLASYGFASDNPRAPLFGTSTPAQNGGDPAYAPYLGAADPIGQMAADLHTAYASAAATFNAANPLASHVGVVFTGDAWVSAINLGIAVRDPFQAHPLQLPDHPLRPVDLWDSDPLTACCTTPIGYHPSSHGVYLDALAVFYDITGVDPAGLRAETDERSPAFRASAAHALGISGEEAQALAIAARETVRAGMPVCRPGAYPLWPCAPLRQP